MDTLNRMQTFIIEQAEQLTPEDTKQLYAVSLPMVYKVWSIILEEEFAANRLHCLVQEIRKRIRDPDSEDNQKGKEKGTEQQNTKDLSINLDDEEDDD